MSLHAYAPGVNRTPGQIKLPFGKYRCRRLADCPPDYLIWLADAADGSVWGELAGRALGLLDEPDDDTDPDPTSAAVALPGITFGWMTTMRRAYRGDPAALAVVERGLAELKKLCTEYTNKPWLTADQIGGGK